MLNSNLELEFVAQVDISRVATLVNSASSITKRVLNRRLLDAFIYCVG